MWYTCYSWWMNVNTLLKFMVYIRVNSLCCTVLFGFDKCIMPWIQHYTITYHYNIIFNSFTALKKTLCSTYSSPSSYFSPYSFKCLYSTVFSRILYSWKHTALSCWLLSCIHTHIYIPPFLFCGFMNTSFLLPIHHPQATSVLILLNVSIVLSFLEYYIVENIQPCHGGFFHVYTHTHIYIPPFFLWLHEYFISSFSTE